VLSLHLLMRLSEGLQRFFAISVDFAGAFGLLKSSFTVVALKPVLFKLLGGTWNSVFKPFTRLPFAGIRDRTRSALY